MKSQCLQVTPGQPLNCWTEKNCVLSFYKVIKTLITTTMNSCLCTGVLSSAVTAFGCTAAPTTKPPADLVTPACDKLLLGSQFSQNWVSKQGVWRNSCCVVVGTYISIVSSGLPWGTGKPHKGCQALGRGLSCRMAESVWVRSVKYCQVKHWRPFSSQSDFEYAGYFLIFFCNFP